jgi:hypothetical protein
MTRTLSIDKVQNEVDKALESPNMPNKLYTSLDNILRCINKIIEQKGQKGWSAMVVSDSGNPLFTGEEQGQFEKAFEPLVPLLLAFFNSNKEESENQIATILENNPQQIYTQSGGFSIDQLYRKGIDSINTIDQKMQEFSSNYGILQAEERYDRTGSDPRPFVPLAVVPPLEPIAFTPVPMRAIVFVTYLIMDTARLMIGFSPIDWPIMRKVLSLLLTLVDVLNGEWKQAILSFSGFYSQNYVIVGTFMKLFIDAFMLISPDLREKIIFGALDVTKSIIMGSLLFLFQTFAPGPIRMAVMPAFDKIKEIIEKNDETFKSKGLPPEKEYMIPNMEHIQNLQALVSDPDLLCSEEFLNGPYRIFKDHKENVFLKTLFSLLRVPTDDETLQLMCGDKLGKPFTDNKTLTQEQIKQQLEQEKEQQLPIQSSPTGTVEINSAVQSSLTGTAEPAVQPSTN